MSTDKQPQVGANELRVTLEGEEHVLSLLWLRLNDPGMHTANGQRLFEISDVVNTASASEAVASAVNEEGLRVQWADGGVSVFTHEWLRRRVLRSCEPPHLCGVACQRLHQSPHQGDKAFQSSR